ncbi:MAG: BMP family ABC transporter substrate-binding protein [Firmicutes bacterium]|nr:BMP family ABC transporter substrate-binding protein [Bacillota bacterium]
MKRSISMVLVLALIIGIFAYVGNHMAEKYNQVSLNVTILVSSEFGDKALNDSAHDGGEMLKEDGMNVKYIECRNTDYKKNMMDAAASSDVVVAVGWEFWEIADVSVEYPNVKFIWADNAVDEPDEYPNLLSVMYAQNEGAYLAGYIAAATSVSGAVGIIGGSEDLATNDFIVGFKQGVRDCNSGIDVLVSYADGVYDDPALGEQLANDLYDQGVDIIFQVAGNTGTGVYKAALERGLFAIGVDKDHKIEFPQYDSCILCSVKKDVGRSIRKLVFQYANENTFQGGSVLMGNMAKGYIDVAYGDKTSVQLVDSNLKNEIIGIKEDIIDGNLKVDSAFNQ